MGSRGSVVAPEESCTSVKVKGMMLVALTKLSLGGAGAATLKVTGVDRPPPGGVLSTAMSLVLPKGPSKTAGSVAFRQVGNGHEAVGAATVIPFCAPLKKTLALLEKFVPVNWMGTAVVGFACTGVLDGMMAVIVGTAASTENVKELLVAPLAILTVTLGVPATRRLVPTCAVNCVSA